MSLARNPENIDCSLTILKWSFIITSRNQCISALLRFRTVCILLSNIGYLLCFCFVASFISAAAIITIREYIIVRVFLFAQWMVCIICSRRETLMQTCQLQKSGSIIWESQRSYTQMILQCHILIHIQLTTWSMETLTYVQMIPFY